MMVSPYGVLRRETQNNVTDYISEPGQMSTNRHQKLVPSKTLESPNKVEPINKSQLSVSELKKVLTKLSQLGLQWTAEIPPRLRSMSGDIDALKSDEFNQIVSMYPKLPLEVSELVLFVLTGTKPDATLVGSDSIVEKKSEVVQSLIVTAEYKAEFFFENAIKLHKLCGIDWEIVIKTHEKDVSRIPACPYAILSLSFHNADNAEHKNVIFASDVRGIRRLRAALSEVEEQFANAITLADNIGARR